MEFLAYNCAAMPKNITKIKSFVSALVRCHYMRISNTHKIYKVTTVHELFDRSAPKKATNLSINSSLLAEAKSLKVNLSATLEQALEAELRETKRGAWIKENKKAIANCNELVKKHGLFADKHRGF